MRSSGPETRTLIRNIRNSSVTIRETTMTVTASYRSSDSLPRTYSTLTPTCSTVAMAPSLTMGNTLLM